MPSVFPTLQEISATFTRCAGRLEVVPTETGKLYMMFLIGMAADRLRQHVPGWEEPHDHFDPLGAAWFNDRAHELLTRGLYRLAGVEMLKGLATAPFHPRLWNLVGMLAEEWRTPMVAARAYALAHWICPVFQEAKGNYDMVATQYPLHDLITLPLDTPLYAPDL